MARLIYSVIASLDGYVEDDKGKFDWAAPDEEVHAFVNELERPVGTYLYGRRMYETMVFWESPSNVAGEPSVMRDYAGIWQSADKIVYSRTLESVTSARTRIERDFDPEAVRRLKATADRDLTIGGAELAARAIEARLVDEYQLFLVPVVVGGGKRALPGANVRLDLELLDERRFGERHRLPPLRRLGLAIMAAVRAINVFNAQSPDGRIDVSRVLGSDATAMYVYDLEPGRSSCPYHYEYDEEWLLVVEGTVVLRAPDGEHTLERGELVCFPPGPAGAHKLMNRSESPARTLMFSSARVPAVSVYPDSDKIGVWPGAEADALVFRRSTAVSYSDGEEGWEEGR